MKKDDQDNRSKADCFVDEFNDDYVEALGIPENDKPECFGTQYLKVIQNEFVTLGLVVKLPSGKSFWLQIDDDDFDMIEVDNMNTSELAARVSKDLGCPIEDVYQRLRKAGFE